MRTEEEQGDEDEADAEQEWVDSSQADSDQLMAGAKEGTVIGGLAQWLGNKNQGQRPAAT